MDDEARESVNLVSPVEPYEMDKRMRFGIEDIVRRVVARSAVKGDGRDLLLRIYLAGVYHGAPPAGRANSQQSERTETMTDDQIKHMVNRFLAWKLPANFHPDCGISFDPISSRGTPHESRREPIGTNLFDYTQAQAMVRHMIEGMPA